MIFFRLNSEIICEEKFLPGRDPHLSSVTALNMILSSSIEIVGGVISDRQTATASEMNVSIAGMPSVPAGRRSRTPGAVRNACQCPSRTSSRCNPSTARC
uniref:(northern house mosquito) hypothetical protein n=1 Tax=Culex pipiens TaxID=7175 RepID=A0A8D8FB15_CULPI